MSAIIVDNRENKLIKLLGSDPTNVEQLELGDIHIRDSDGTTKAIIERKTLSDLAASIKDGRLKEQKMRLLQERESKGVLLIYVIESNNIGYNEEAFVGGMTAKAIITTVMNTMFRDRIFVVNTLSIVDTCDFIKGFAARLSAYKCDWMDGRKSLSIETHQDAIIKSRKKDNVGSETVFVMQLCAIPGISTKKAVALKEDLGVASMRELIEVLSSPQCADRKAAMKKLMEVKGLGKVLAENVLDELGIKK